MFSEIFNYIVIPTLLSAGAFGVYYIWNPEDSKYFISHIAWYGVNMYSKASIYFENLAQYEEILSDDDNADDTEDEEVILSYFNSENQIVVSLGTDHKTLPEEWWKDSNFNVDLLMLKKCNGDEEQFKIFHNYKELANLDNEWNTIEKQFVQVELEQDNKVIDIHKHLNKFYIIGNRILSKPFLEWYLKTWYDITLSNEYVLKIFDKDVNLFSISAGTHIYINNNSYSVVDTIDTEDDESSDNDTASYEGASDE